MAKDLRPRSAHGIKAQHYEALGLESASGADMIGWVVVGWSNGQIFGIAASSQELLQLADGRSPQSFEKIIADYEQEHPSTLTKKNAEPSQSEAPSQSKPEVTANAKAVAQSSPPASPEQIITLTRPVEVAIAYGKTKLPAGLKLKVLSREGTSINAGYLGDTVVIPASAAVPR